MANAFSHISSIAITNFEVVQGTGPADGPRSPGAPTAIAGADQTVPVGVPVQLQGFVSYANTVPAISWKLYSGPANVSFGNPAQTNTTTTFNTPGIYKLMLSASDGVHAVAYAAVTFTATQSLRLAAAPLGTNVNLSWTGGSPPYVVERSANIPFTPWQPLVTNNSSSVVVPMNGQGMFFRVRGQ